MKTESYKTFREVVLNEPAAHHAICSGGSTEDAAIALANQLKAARERVIELELISPRKIRAGDKSMVWRCPDSLIPDASLG